MCGKVGICWVEYRDPIALIDHPSNTEICLYWYRKRTHNKWTYDLTFHLMVDLRPIIVLASILYIADVDAHELHLGG